MKKKTEGKTIFIGDYSEEKEAFPVIVKTGEIERIKAYAKTKEGAEQFIKEYKIK